MNVILQAAFSNLFSRKRFIFSYIPNFLYIHLSLCQMVQHIDYKSTLVQVIVWPMGRQMTIVWTVDVITYHCQSQYISFASKRELWFWGNIIDERVALTSQRWQPIRSNVGANRWYFTYTAQVISNEYFDENILHSVGPYKKIFALQNETSPHWFLESTWMLFQWNEKSTMKGGPLRHWCGQRWYGWIDYLVIAIVDHITGVGV